jgi:HEAT repeat protein
MRQLLAALLLIAAGAASAAQYERADLVRMMRSADAKDRALARQLLPRYGVNRIEDILGALADPSEPVWRTTSNILSDLANGVSVPGREKDRDVLVGALMSRLAAKPGTDEVARLLNIVHLALPEGTDVAPIAQYLSDPALQMKARDALQLAGTTQAQAALAGALESADGTFALALIDSLGLLHDATARPVLEARLSDDDAAIRAASARALAWTGDLALADNFKKIVAKAKPDTSVAASDAYLRLADAVYARGGQFDDAMEMYEWAAKKCPDIESRAAAIASMGRHGDERVVAVILKAAAHEKKSTIDHAALEALAVLPGTVGSRVILAEHDALFKAFGPTLYEVYGCRGDEAFQPILIDALKSDDAYARRVATLALLDSNRGPGIEAASKMGEGLKDVERDQFIDRLAMKAIECREKGLGASAGAAYAGVYRLATTEKDKQFALAGMMQFPTEEAFTLVKDMIGGDQLNQLSVPFLAGIARALYAAKRPEDAGRVIDAITPRIATPQDMQAFLGVAQGGEELAKKLGFITKWQVIGPFPWSVSDGFKDNPIGAPAVDLATAITPADGKPRKWQPAQGGGASAMVELTGIFGMVTGQSAFGYAEIDVPEAMDAQLRMGSDDGIKVWVNGAVVHEHNVDRGAMADQDQAAAKLNAGKNAILVEITQGGGGWNFCLRVVDAKGKPVAFTN